MPIVVKGGWYATKLIIYQGITLLLHFFLSGFNLAAEITYKWHFKLSHIGAPG